MGPKEVNMHLKLLWLFTENCVGLESGRQLADSLIYSSYSQCRSIRSHTYHNWNSCCQRLLLFPRASSLFARRGRGERQRRRQEWGGSREESEEDKPKMIPLYSRGNSVLMGFDTSPAGQRKGGGLGVSRYRCAAAARGEQQRLGRTPGTSMGWGPDH